MKAPSRNLQGIIIGLLIGLALGLNFYLNTIIDLNQEIKEDTEEIVECIHKEEKQAEIVTQPVTDTFEVTAYCSCEICCGEWALNRPKDENGNDIVIGSSGRRLVPGYSVAVDPDIIPLGTIIYIDGKEYRADDTGGMIQGNKIDIYFATHSEALDFDTGMYDVEISGYEYNNRRYYEGK